jgi:hypothetical protein
MNVERDEPYGECEPVRAIAIESTKEYERAVKRELNH